jgi:hypothetical protein
MFKSLPDIESYDHKVSKLFKEAKLSRSGLFDIEKTGRKIGLDSQEIETIYYHLIRSNMVETASGSLVRISKYGHMMYNGQINHGYAPM